MKRKYIKNQCIKKSGKLKSLPDFFYERVVGIFIPGWFEKVCKSWKTYPVPFLLTIANTAILTIRYFYCLYWVEGDVFCLNPAYITVFTLFPFAFFLMSTMCQKFEAYGIKRGILWGCIVNALLTVMQLPFKGIYLYLVYRYILLIKVAGSMTYMMVINLSRICLLLSVILPSLISCSTSE